MLVLMFILEVDLILDQIPWMTCQLERGGGGTEGVFCPLLELICPPPPPAHSFSNLLSLSLMWIWHLDLPLA